MFSLIKGNRTLAIISLIAIVNSLGYGIVFPILYSYSIRFGLSDFQNGLLFASFSACQFLSTPIIGRMSDKYGRRPLLLISLAGTALSFFILAFAPSAIFLLIGRMLDGITAGNIPVANAVISDSIDPKDRPRGFGIISASFGFGFVFGPTISALTVGISPSLPFIIAGIISIIAVISTFFLLPETNKHIGQVHHGKLFDFGRLVKAAFHPQIGVVLLITLFHFMAFFQFIYAFQPFTVKVLKLSPNQIATVFTGLGIIGLLSQLFLVQRVVKKLGLKRAFNFAFMIVAACFALMFINKGFVTFIAIIAVLGFANALVQPLLTTILTDETDPKSQGSLLGLNSSFMSIGQILGPILGGIFASFYIPLPFLIAAFSSVLCIYLSTKVLKPGAKKEAAF